MTQNSTKTIINFAKKINKDLQTDALKKDWEKSEIWWLFTQMAREINAMDKAMTDEMSDKKVDEKAVSIASFAMIIAEQYKNKR